jgi:hypothetical protein
LNWSTRIALTNWAGVTVSGTPSRVTQLNLSEQGLTGSIPSELGSLSELTVLWLFSNELMGSIPTQLGNLSKLTRLYLNSNRLTGSIPSELGNLSELTRLTLSNNQLDGTIPVQLGSLSNLTHLIVEQNQLTGSIPAQLGNLSKLTHLWLLSNQLSGKIPTQLGDLSKLTQLLLRHNQLTGAIPSELGNLTSLETLSLKDNQLSGCIPPALRTVGEHDLDLLDLPYCDDLPPAPEGLSVSLADDTFSLTWDAMSGADQYEAQYRTSADEDWVALPAVTETSTTFTPEGGPACGTTYEFQVRAYGDGVTLVAVWGEFSAVASETTAACNQAPEFGAESYAFSVFEDAAINDAVGTVSATDADAADSVTYSISDGNTEGKFAIGSSTGTITVKNALDYETTPSYTLTVQATDNNGGTATASVAITVTDVPEDPPPAPGGLSASLTDSTFTLTWNAVSGADEYEAQYRTSADEDWVALPAVTETSTTFAPAGGPACGTTYEFQVRAYGDGVTYVTDWGITSDAVPHTTSACN